MNALRHVFEVEIRAPAASVWEAIMDPEQCAVAFGSRANFAGRTGDQWAMVDTTTGAPNVSGELLEVDRPRRLRHSWHEHSAASAADPPSMVTWELVALGSHTLLRVTHQGFESETETFRSAGAGWPPTLDALKEAIERAIPVSATEPMHVYEVYIRTTPERLWRALTDSTETVRYFHRTAFTSSLTPGGAWSCILPDGSHALDGTVIEVDAPRRLVLTFEMTHNAEARLDSPSRITWEIIPMGPACLLRLTHDRFGRENATYRAVRFGWNFILSGLKTWLETGEELQVDA
jgi:uncharacterized protein YndB with AHSA1/START domain